MATPIPPPSSRHLRLLRLLLSGLILGATLKGATARRPGELSLWAQAAGRSGAGIAGRGILPPGATLVLPATALASPGPSGRPGPLGLDWVNRSGPLKARLDESSSQVPGGECRFHELLVFVSGSLSLFGVCLRMPFWASAAIWFSVSLRGDPVSLFLCLWFFQMLGLFPLSVGLAAVSLIWGIPWQSLRVPGPLWSCSNLVQSSCHHSLPWRVRATLSSGLRSVCLPFKRAQSGKSLLPDGS